MLAPLSGRELFQLQRTGAGTPPRIHLDIESDDVPAEVERVLKLGASVVRAAAGIRHHGRCRRPALCVVPVQTGADFEHHAITWGR